MLKSSRTAFRPYRDAHLDMRLEHVHDCLAGATLGIAEGDEQGIEWLGM